MEAHTSSLTLVYTSNVEQLRTVLVTGGTGTIGSAIARAILAQNTTSSARVMWRVIANYAHNAERANNLQRETNCELYRADVADESQVRDMFNAISELYAVVHCAGASHNNLVLRQTPGEWRESLRVNADSAFLVTRESLRILPRGGRLIFLASRVGERGNIGQSAYAASKAAVIALMKSAAREAGENGISVNAICPGFVPSEMTQNLSNEAMAKFRSQNVFDEFGSGEAVASAVWWLLSDAAREISGQVIHCDGRIA